METSIKKLLLQKESRKLEFKRELPSNDKIIKTAIAFSNSNGGHLIIGVDEHNKIIGIDEDKIIEFEEKISNIIYDNCYPSIIPEIFSFRIKGKTLLIVQFYPSSQKPHYLKSIGKRNGIFIRVGSSNRVATIDIIEELERQRRNISFDSVVNYDLEYKKELFKDFDSDIVNKLNESPNIVTYEKLGLVKKERDSYYLTNLGILLSSRKQEYFPLAKIECARFKGEIAEIFIDQATFDKGIVSSIESAMTFIKKNIKLGASIGEIYRKDRWEYPLLAIREVLVNAIVHRDYFIKGSDIKVAIFDDMVEITSPGILMIDKEKLGKGYSELRNPLLGNLLKKFKIIEQWGSGFQKIKKELEEYPEIKLNIDDSSSFVQIQFIRRDISDKKISEGISGGLKEGINGGLKLLLHTIKENPGKRTNELAKLLKISERTIEKWIKKLKQQEEIVFKGSKKTGGYFAISSKRRN